MPLSAGRGGASIVVAAAEVGRPVRFRLQSRRAAMRVAACGRR